MEFRKTNMQEPEIGSWVKVLTPEKDWTYGKVVETAWFESYDDAPRGELSYTWTYSRPFPQVLIKLVNGLTVRADGDDLLEGEVQPVDDDFNVENYSPKTLGWFLDNIIIDVTEAAHDLGTYDDHDIGRSITSLWQTISERLQPILVPLREYECTRSNFENTVYLGEFDSEYIIFRSTKVGKAIRNDGVPAFELNIRVDGYAPTTFELKISEIFVWDYE